MKKFFFSFVFLFIAVCANAQFGINVTAGLAVGKYSNKNFLEEEGACGAGMAYGFGIEYMFNKNGKLKPVIGADALINSMKKKSKQKILNATAASSLSGALYAYASPYAGLKYFLYEEDSPEGTTGVYVSGLVRYSFGQLNDITLNYKTSSSTSTSETIKFEAEGALGGQIGIGFREGNKDFRLFYDLHGRRSMVARGETDPDAPKYRTQNIGFTATIYFW